MCWLMALYWEMDRIVYWEDSPATGSDRGEWGGGKRRKRAEQTVETTIINA